MKITEMILEKEVTRLLEQWLQAQAVNQPSVGGKRPDVILTIDDFRFVIELELGAPRKMLEAVAQGYEYAQRVGADGIIGLVYPEEARRTVATQQDVVDVVTTTPVSALVLSPLLSQHFPNIALDQLASKLRDLLSRKTPSSDVGLITNML